MLPSLACLPRRAALILCCLTLLVASAAAQSAPSGGGGQEPANPEAGGGGVAGDLLEAIGSGSRVLIRAMQPGEERDLVENPRFDGQESPRAAILTFTGAMDLVDRGYAEIGYARALRSLPPEAGRAEADALFEAFLRLGPVSAAAVPGAGSVRASGDTRYEFFPRGTDHLWVWQALDEPPVGEIAVERGADGAWRFTPETAAGASGLAESLAPLPPRYGLDDRGEYFFRAFAPLAEENGLAAWGGFLGVTALGGLLGWLVFRTVRWLASRARESEASMIATTLGGLGAALGVLLFSVAFTVALGFLTLGPVLRPLQVEIPQFILVVALALLAVSLIDTVAAFVRRGIDDDGSGHYERMVVNGVRRVLRTLVIAIVLLFVLQNVFGLNVGALIVGFGVVGLALGLAAQDSVKNLFGAVTIYVNRPFVIGDWIQFHGQMGQHWGTVEDIKLQSTKLRDLRGNVITLPNMLFVDREVQNLSARGYIRREVNLAVPYRPDAGEAMRAVEALRDVFTDTEVIEHARAKGRGTEPHVSFAGFAEAWLTIRGYHFYYMDDQAEDDSREPAAQRDTERGWFTYLDHCTLVNRKIVDTFGERNIEFAFPTQTVELIRGDDRA